MTEWNIYIFQPCSSGLKRQLLYRGLKAGNDKAAIDTICKHLSDKVQRGALFAREAEADDWCRPPAD
jgi:hypothetical protein